ncbi:MAG TPA: response regulator [Thermoanaerobaculia bacterium]|nr:response regulator [Thermoanaerobaculia bacterium]
MPDSDPLTILMAGGPLPADEVIRIGRDAAAALTAVHGELWPSAIAVAADGVGIVPPGIADRSRYGQYAAPERILGKPATPASDVFSLGAILFHAVSGRPPFRGSSSAEVMLSICTDKPLDAPPHVPPELTSILARCLRREPSERYASPAALHDVLDTLLRREVWPGRRILLADDDGPIRDLYTHMAARVGVEADVVASGRDAIEAFKTRKYDLAMLDLNMPRLSGWEVLDYLRSRYDVRPRRLFIVTGFTDQRISAADRELVTAVLYKPVVSEELRALVTACLKGGEIDMRAILRNTDHHTVPLA